MGKELIGSLELGRIYQMDCIEGLKLIPDNSVDTVITDPPYGINYKSTWTDNFETIQNDDNINWLSDLFKEIDRVTKKDSHIYCFTGLDFLPEFVSEIKRYYKFQNIITVPRTMKGGAGSKTQSFSYQNEYVLFATKGSRKFEETQILKPSEKYLKDKRKNPKEWLYRLPDYWGWLKASEHNLKRNHPTQKTVEVIETMIMLSSKESEVVLDPFMGSGTTAVAAARTGRKFIGFELESDYIEVANKRLEAIQDTESDDILTKESE